MKALRRLILLATLLPVTLLGSASSARAEGYVLGPRDIITVTVQQLDEPQQEARIGEDGTITLSLVGTVKAAGFTVDQLEEVLAAVYGEFVRSPQVQVIIKEFHSKEISVLGEVARPGLYKLTGNTTLLEVLSIVGGLKEGHADHIVILRPSESGEGEPENLVVDTRVLFTPEGQALNYEVLDGDVIHVPRTQSETATFYVFGEVRRPGPYQIPAGTTLTIMKAITMAGGLSDRASKRGIRIKREVGDKIEEFKVNMDSKVRPQDVVVVPESFF